MWFVGWECRGLVCHGVCSFFRVGVVCVAGRALGSVPPWRGGGWEASNGAGRRGAVSTILNVETAARCRNVSFMI